MAEPFDWDSDLRRLRAETDLIIHDLALRQVEIEHKALAEMIERMFASPERAGIAVVISHEQSGDLDNGYYMHEYRDYRLDEHVPFGHIYEFPSMESYQLWEERGWPT